MDANKPDSAVNLFAHHPRRWQEFDYVYPVLSRRAKGLSVGINLNPDKVCNWDCVYCQVDRKSPPRRTDVDLAQLKQELEWMLDHAAGGRIWQEAPFQAAPEPLRRLNDIAFSGDGEPTTCEQFEEACDLVGQLKSRRGLSGVKVILLTNMTMLHRPGVQRGLEILDRHEGEIWAKLEAGTEEYYKQVDRSSVPLRRVLENILAAGRIRPLVIQSLFMRCRGVGPSEAEFDAYLSRLQELIQGGGRISLVQIYTVARATAEPWVAPLPQDELESLARRLRQRLPGLACEIFGGIGA